MNILVVGGAGYVGSAVASTLVASGHEVVVYDNLGQGHRAAVPTGATLIVGDIGDATALDAAFRSHRVNAVIHLAALIEAGESMVEPERYFRNNATHSLTLFEAMVRHGVLRLVFSSSAAIYGNPLSVPIDEDAMPRPTNPYGESKSMVERILAWMNRAHGLRYACLRYFNVAGAASADIGEDHRPESHLIPLTLKVALGQSPSISIFGTDYPTPDGTCMRDYVHVADVANAHLLALDALDRSEALHFNLGNGDGFSVREIVDMARRVTGHPIPAIEQPRRLGDPATLVASSRRIREQLGWKPRHADLESIVASAWGWHRRHPNGYAD